MHVDPAGDCLIPSGTPDCPFPLIEYAVTAAWDGLRIKIQTGSYPEPLTIDKKVQLVADGGPVTIGG